MNTSKHLIIIGLFCMFSFVLALSPLRSELAYANPTNPMNLVMTYGPQLWDKTWSKGSQFWEDLNDLNAAFGSEQGDITSKNRNTVKQAISNTNDQKKRIDTIQIESLIACNSQSHFTDATWDLACGNKVKSEAQEYWNNYKYVMKIPKAMKLENLIKQYNDAGNNYQKKKEIVSEIIDFFNDQREVIEKNRKALEAVMVEIDKKMAKKYEEKEIKDLDPRLSWESVFGVNSEECRATGNNAIVCWLKAVLSWAIGIVGGLATLAIIFGGFLYMASGGNPDRISSAKSIIFGAIAGILLLILIGLIFKIMGVPFLENPSAIIK